MLDSGKLRTHRQAMMIQPERIQLSLGNINQKCFYLKEDKDIKLDSGTTIALVPNKHLLYNQHGSAAESPRGSNDPTRGICEDIRRFNISSDDGAPKPNLKVDKNVNPYSDLDLERDIFGGNTYEEFDREYRYQGNLSSDSTEKKENSSKSQYKDFKAFPGSKTRNTVYLQRVKSDDQFNRWVHCLIGQLKLAGLESFIPNKSNDWSTDIIDNDGLSNSIVFFWEECAPKECCPEWVHMTPYDKGFNSESAVYNLLTDYDRLNKNLDIWKEAIRHLQKDTIPSNLQTLWLEGTQMYHKFYVRGKYRDIDSLLQCFTEMTVEAYADKSYMVKQELSKNNKLDIPTALRLVRVECRNSVNSKRANLSEEDKGRKPYERSKKNTSNSRTNWNKDSNGTYRHKKSAKNYNKSDVIKKKGKTNYIKKNTPSGDDDSAGEDPIILRQH